MYEKMFKELQESFKESTDQELIATFNRYVGNKGWCSAKGVYLRALREEIDSRCFDQSELISSGGLNLSRRVVLIANRLEHAASDS